MPQATDIPSLWGQPQVVVPEGKAITATLVADVAGALRTMELAHGEATGFDGDQGGGIILQQFFSLERRGTSAQYEFGKRPGVPPVTITMTLTAQRITTQGRLLLKIDSMSVEAIELPA